RGRPHPGRIREIRGQPPRRGQAAALCRDVLDQGAARRRRRHHRRHLPRTGCHPRLRFGRLGLANGVFRDDHGLMRVERNIAMNPIPLPIIDLRRAAAVLLLILAAAFLAFPMTEGAAQTVNPTAQSVQEEMLFEELQGPIAGRVSIPNERAGTLIAPENRDWSNMRRGTLFTISMVAIVGALVVLTAFYLIKGPVPIEAGRSGRTILRFNGLERFAHWLTAVTFIVLGITGLNVTVGRRHVLPLIGEDALGTLSIWMKITHN